MPSRIQELAGSHGPIPLEDSPRRNQCYQHWEDLVRINSIADRERAIGKKNSLIILIGKRSFSLLALSQPLTTQPISVLFQLVHMVNVPSSSSLLTPVPSQLLVVSPQVTSPTTSPDLSRNPASSLSPTHVPMLKLSRKLPTSTFQLSHFATLTPQPSSSM